MSPVEEAAPRFSPPRFSPPCIFETAQGAFCTERFHGSAGHRPSMIAAFDEHVITFDRSEAALCCVYPESGR